MFRKSFFVFLVLALSLVAVVPAFAAPGQPNFGPQLYADGEVWGTKAAAILPAANENTLQSFDKLFVITKSNNKQVIFIMQRQPAIN